MAKERNTPTANQSGGDFSPRSIRSEAAMIKNAPEMVGNSSAFREKSGKNDDVLLTAKQDKKLSKYSRKAEKKENKYFKKESKLPKRHKLRLTEKQGDGKRGVKLHFEEQTKAQKENCRF